tara:strand:+ start:81 stop:677 length:597 start_codon:yes stop_codon:yes gene_type:complete
MANLTSFKGKIGYGVRPNLFMVQVTDLESNLNDSDKVKGTDADFTFLCRSAGIPASTIGTVEVPFRGRVIKLPGDRTFESWTITVMADEDMSVRGYFEKWMEKLNKHENGAGYTADFASTLKVSQLARGTSASDALKDPHSVVRSYDFYNAFPTNIAQIDLSYDNNNTIAEYTVEFQYDWWEANKADGSIDIGAGATI